MKRTYVSVEKSKIGFISEVCYIIYAKAIILKYDPDDLDGIKISRTRMVWLTIFSRAQMECPAKNLVLPYIKNI